MSDKSSYTIKQVSWREYKGILRQIRTDVFIIEQHVPMEEEWDGFDEEAIHVVALTTDEIPVGTARLLPTGQIGRMAVLKEYRGAGIGSALLKKLLEIAERETMNQVFLNAQQHAIDFYKKFDFVITGNVFMEAGIPHQKMTQSLP